VVTGRVEEVEGTKFPAPPLPERAYTAPVVLLLVVVGASDVLKSSFTRG
jgi:hypothetical protein